MLTRRAIILATAAIAAMCAPAAAQDAYPARPIKMLVPFPPGGPTDLVARVLADRMATTLGQSIIIENRPGANGNIAADAAARSTPDGYTVLYNTSAIALSPSLFKKLNYDVKTDLVPIALTAVVPLVIAVHPGVPAKTISEFIDYMKANPGKLNYGSAGAGNVTHLGAALFLKSQGLSAAHVPFAGSAPAVTALAGGHIQFVTDTVNSSQSLILDGKLRALAVMTKNRVKALPDVPTLTEAGLANFDIGAWQGLMAPAKTPPEIIAKLNAAALEALKDRSVLDKLAIQGAQPLGSSPEAYGTFIAAEIERWAGVIKDAGVKID